MALVFHRQASRPYYILTFTNKPFPYCFISVYLKVYCVYIYRLSRYFQIFDKSCSWLYFTLTLNELLMIVIVEMFIVLWCSVKIEFLKNFVNFNVKHLPRSLVFNKVAGYSL